MIITSVSVESYVVLLGAVKRKYMYCNTLARPLGPTRQTLGNGPPVRVFVA